MLQLPNTEKSFWREAYKESLYPQLSQDLRFDVVIVGAGITGLTAAYLLKKSGYTVAVLEKDTVGGGTTGRTTGKVTAQHNLIYRDLQNRLGKKTAKTYGEANLAAVAQVANIITKEKINCDWQQKDNYVFTDNPDKIGYFKEEAKTAANLGLPASFETSTPLPFNVKAAVKFTSQDQGSLHAQKYVIGLAQAINGQGSCVFENSNVTGIRDGKPGSVKTSQATITATDIIVATNVPTWPLIGRGGYCMLEYPKESYLIAGPLKKEVGGMYISPDKNHYSILPAESNGKQMLLIGGKGHISGLSGNTHDRYQQLANYAEEHFGLTSITHRWSDRDYLSYDSIPLVGKLYPWSKHLYVATAFMKWGLSNGTAAAMILHDLIAGKDNAWAATFDSTRLKPVTSIPRVAAKYLRGDG
ncbi:MAG: NAD(P)/FAD-dependent oxidoreductase [Candidatus Saccharimonadales bacterium]